MTKPSLDLPPLHFNFAAGSPHQGRGSESSSDMQAVIEGPFRGTVAGESALRMVHCTRESAASRIYKASSLDT